jgi:type 1 fimbria pilin
MVDTSKLHRDADERPALFQPRKTPSSEINQEHAMFATPLDACRHMPTRHPVTAKIVRNIIRFLLMVCGAYGMLFATQAHAACSFGNFQLYLDLPPTLTVPADAPVGLELASATSLASVVAGKNQYSCTLSTPPNFTTWTYVDYAGSLMKFTSPSGLDGVYDTNIPGIGIKITAFGMDGRVGTPVLPFATNFTKWIRGYGSSYTVDVLSAGGLKVTASLVVTGKVPAGGSIASGQIAHLDVFWGAKNTPPPGNEPSPGRAVQLKGTLADVFLRGSITVEAGSPTCSVNASSTQTVNLGNYPANAFTGIGSTTAPKSFNINFDCSGGTQNESTNIYLTMTDVTDPGNRSDILNLDSTSTAKGVGVRIERSGGTAVTFGADSNTIGNPGQWQAGSVNTGTGTFTIPLQARLIQTGAVQQGSVSAKTTFTAAYN